MVVLFDLVNSLHHAVKIVQYREKETCLPQIATVTELSSKSFLLRHSIVVETMRSRI